MVAWILGACSHEVPAAARVEDTASEPVAAPAEPVPSEPGADPIAAGEELFLRQWVPGDPRTPNGDGLGPKSNAESCGACHHQGGAGTVMRPFPDPTRDLLSTRISSDPADRSVPALFGAGRIDAIPDAAIEGQGPVDGFPEITGRVGRDARGRVARFGWEGDVARLDAFVSRASADELGLETPDDRPRGREAPGPDLDRAEVDALTAFVASLPAPVELETPGADQGRELFAQIGCTSCHRPSLGGADGLYSDLLLHDVGEQLYETYGCSGRPATREWRTPPLWGARDSAPYLHDGRVSTLREAIQLHGGEALKVEARWEQLSKADQQLVLRFLQSLAAPPLGRSAPR